MAVIAVGVYHFGDGDASWLPGGFIGVDIFFVLSGYLITGLLLSEHARTARISLRDFWVRRARRLVPALAVMMLAVIAYLWWMTPPESYPLRRKDIVWTVGYLANWHFLQSVDDYFAAYSTASPLRHTWSLAVEEQFYLVWPVLVVALLWLGRRALRRRGPGDRVLVIGAAAVAGMVVSAWAMATTYTVDAPSRAYYSTQGRVQELFAGVLLAVLFAWYRGRGRALPAPIAGIVRDRPWPMAATGAAVLVMLAALLTLSDTGAFYYHGGALLISLATAGVIGSAELRPGSVLAGVLSWRPAVALGRISYGIYLWHWPITVVFPVQNLPVAEQVWRQTVRVVLTVLIAALSFRFIERPVQRDRRVLRSRVRVLGAVATSMVVVVGAGLSATALPPGWADQLTVTSDRSCLGESVTSLIGCLAPEGSVRTQQPAFVLLGDSTARALGNGFDTWAQQNGTTWYEAAWKRCSATGITLVPHGHTKPDLPAVSCSAQAPVQIREALETYRPATVLVAELQPSTLAVLQDGQLLQPGTVAHSAALVSAYQRLIDEIASYGGHAVFVEMPPPGESLAPLVARGRPAGRAWNPGAGRARFVPGFNAVLRAATQSRPDDASLVSLTDVLCPGGRCPAVIGNTIVRNDGTHYSINFAQRLAPILLQRAGVS